MKSYKFNHPFAIHRSIHPSIHSLHWNSMWLQRCLVLTPHLPKLGSSTWIFLHVGQQLTSASVKAVNAVSAHVQKVANPSHPTFNFTLAFPSPTSIISHHVCMNFHMNFRTDIHHIPADRCRSWCARFGDTSPSAPPFHPRDSAAPPDVGRTRLPRLRRPLRRPPSWQRRGGCTKKAEK